MTTRLRILHTEASAGWGGQELRILAEMQGLRARGHRLELAAPAGAKIFREAQALGFDAHDLPIARKRPRGMLALRRLLARQRFDVLNAHSSTDAWLAALARATLADPPPLVRTRHISAPVPRDLCTRWLYERATCAVVTTGEKIRRELIEVNGFRRVPIVSVPTGIDPRRFAPADDPAAARARLGLRPDAFTCGIVATLRSWKGHRYLIEAFAALAASCAADTQLLIVGDGPQRAALEEQVRRAGLGDRVRFAGHDPQPEKWFQALDAFVLPSYANEGVPQALMQAMMSALPCVTCQVGAVGEVAQHERTALIVPAQDAAALQSALQRLLRDAALRQRLGAHAREFALTHCTFDAMCDAMERLFAQVVRREQWP